MRQATERNAGRWLIGGVWAVARKVLVITALGMLVYSVGGWSALAGLFKAVAAGEARQ